MPGAKRNLAVGRLWQTMGVAADTLYDLLGVPRHADLTEIRAAYRRLSKIYHPDLGGTAAIFRQLQEAHEILTDPIRRSAYDHYLTTSVDRPVEPNANHGGPRSSPQGSQPNDRGPAQSAFSRMPHNRSQPRSRKRTEASDEASPHNRRRLATWSRADDFLLLSARGRRRQEMVTVAWTTSVIVAGVLIGLLLEPTHGIVLLLLVIMAAFAWRQHESIKRRAERRDRAAQAAAELNRTARETAERKRATRPARTPYSQAGEPTASGDPPHREPSVDATRAGRDMTAEQAARDGNRSEDPGGTLLPAQLEDTMAKLLGALDMTEIQRMGGRCNLAVDVAARDSVGRTIVVRCSRNAKGVKLETVDIQRFIDMAYVLHQPDLKLLVTASDFTPGARALAERHAVRLMNGMEIEELVRHQHEWSN
jgi:hypothetical protein